MDEKLLELLAGLHASEWELGTVAGEWKVRDVAAHLLDTALRSLSIARDGFVAEPAEIHSPEDLARFINGLNRDGVRVYRRLSPPVLLALMRIACRDCAEFHESLDPFAPAAFGVSWAGEQRSFNWFNTARELTERWHHQQQIRLATGRPGIMVRELYHPVLDCFLRGLPYRYRNVDAAPGTAVRVEITGECGGAWQMRREAAEWALIDPEDHWDARIVLPQEIAWRVFTKGIARGEAAALAGLHGDAALAAHVLELTAIVA